MRIRWQRHKTNPMFSIKGFPLGNAAVFAFFALGVEQCDLMFGGHERVGQGCVCRADSPIADRSDEFATGNADAELAALGRVFSYGQIPECWVAFVCF